METKSQTNSKKAIIVVVVIALLVVLSIVLYYFSNYKSQNGIIAKTESASNVQGVEDKSVSTINFSVNNLTEVKTYKVAFVSGKSLLDTLNDYKAKDDTFTFETMESTFGIYLLGVNGRLADTEKKEFWNIKVNGVDSQVGIKDLIVNSDDNIQFILTTY